MGQGQPRSELFRHFPPNPPLLADAHFRRRRSQQPEHVGINLEHLCKAHVPLIDEGALVYPRAEFVM